MVSFTLQASTVIQFYVVWQQCIQLYVVWLKVVKQLLNKAGGRQINLSFSFLYIVFLLFVI